MQKEYAMEHLTAEDITNIQCSNSTYFPGSRMAEHQISFEALGEKHQGIYTVQQNDDGESFTFHTDGKDLWETMPDNELRKLAYALSSAVEFHYWESKIDACATTGDVEEVRLSLMETEGKKITSEQSCSLAGALENKRNDLLHNTREGQAELLSEDIVCLMYEINPLPYGVQRDAAADIAAMTQNLLSANETLAMTIGAIQDTVLLNTSEAIPTCKAVLEKIESFLGQEHPMTQEMYGTQLEQPPQAGLQDNGQYRYYSTQRPVSPGTFPKGDNKPVEMKFGLVSEFLLKGNEKLIQGTYDKKGLPDDWAEFMESVFEFMSFYGWGEIMNPSVYGKVRRCDNDMIYCSVEFEDGCKSYFYISDDDSVQVGDFVIVPAGKDNHEAVVEVVKKEYFAEENVPLPMEKTKHIIRKCTENDLGLPDNESI